MAATAAKPTDLRSRTIRSLFWQTLGVGGQRVCQFIGPVVLSRTLPDTDIGLFGVVALAIGAVEALTAFVGEQSLIWSDRGAERRYLDTLLTVRVIRSLLLTVVLCALAPAFAWYFHDTAGGDRYWVTGLFLALAGNGLLDALQSPARLLRMKRLEFRRVAVGDGVAAIVGMSITIALAFAWRDVWALLVGQLAATAIRTGTSYIVAPHRPRFCLDRGVWRELRGYAVAAAGAPFLLMSVFAAPGFVLGRIDPTKGLFAVYDYSSRFARLPEEIFLRVLGPVAVPAYSELKHDLVRLRAAWLRAISMFLLVGMPLTAALMWMGNAVPAFLYGDNYGQVPWLFALLALHGGIAGLTSVVGPLFWAIGEPHKDRNAQLLRVIAIYGLGIPGALWFGAAGFAAAAAIAVLLALVVSLWFALPRLQVRLGDLAEATRGGLLATGGLLLTCLALDATVNPTGSLRLLLGGACAGPLLLWLLWARVLRRRTTQTAPPPQP